MFVLCINNVAQQTKLFIMLGQWGNSQYRKLSEVYTFSFDPIDYHWHCQQPNSDTENYLSMWCQTHYDVLIIDKNNNISFEGLNIHYLLYHSRTVRLSASFTTSDNVCLNQNLHNYCCNSIFTTLKTLIFIDMDC